MNRADYVALSDTIRETIQACTDNGRGDIRARGVADLAVRMAEVFAADNPRFDRDRFLTACNVEYAGPMSGLAFDRPDNPRPI